MDVTLDHIEFSHGETPLIQDLSCCFSQGKFHAVLGPNGSGKTTLLDLIAGFYTPRKGQVLLANTPVPQWNKPALARHLTRVSQNERINFPFTVEEVVMMGRHPHIPRFSHPRAMDYDQVDAVMELTEISEMRHRPITELSGGEQQRCIFARALCQDTPILLLDEAFSNMDIHHTLSMLSRVKETVALQKKTVIAVIHDLNLAASHADEILFLKQGRILAQGPTDQVLTRDILQQTFNIHTQVEFNAHVQAKQIYYKPL